MTKRSTSVTMTLASLVLGLLLNLSVNVAAAQPAPLETAPPSASNAAPAS